MSPSNHFAVRRSPLTIFLFATCVYASVFSAAAARGQEAAADAGGNPTFASAVDFLPASTAGLVRCSDVPAFCETAGETGIGRLLDDPLLAEFREAQQQLAKNFLDSLDQRIGLKLDDVYAIASGEVVAAWLPYPKNQRRPFAFCVVADIRGRQAEAKQVLDQVAVDMNGRGASSKDITYRGQTIRVYTPRTKVGQLKIEQIAIWMDDSRIIAADHDAFVSELLDAIAGQSNIPTLGADQTFALIRDRNDGLLAADRKREAITDDGQPLPAQPLTVQWYAEPFAMGQIIKSTLEIDRGNQVEILKLLQNQGFDAIQAAGGSIGIRIGSFDWLHRGTVLAPPTTDQPDRYRLAARAMNYEDQPLGNIPGWLHDEAASMLKVHMKAGEAFLKLETLVDEAWGSEIFGPMLEDIKDEEIAAGVDIVRDVVPNLGDEIYLLTDNTLPADVNSERMLVAIEIDTVAPIEKSLQKIMEAEPGVVEIDDIPGTQIWQFDEAAAEDDFEDDLFGDFENDFATDEPEQREDRILPRYAVTLLTNPANQKSYVLFASHTDLLLKTVKRMQAGADGGFATAGQVPAVLAAMKSLGAKDVAIARIARFKLTRRVKYELLRQGELKDSGSVLASLIKKLIPEEDIGDSDPIKAAKLPTFDKIEDYFGTGGGFVETTDDGWSMTGFVLKP